MDMQREAAECHGNQPLVKTFGLIVLLHGVIQMLVCLSPIVLRCQYFAIMWNIRTVGKQRLVGMKWVAVLSSTVPLFIPGG